MPDQQRHVDRAPACDAKPAERVPVLRNYSITPTRAPADVRDAIHPAPIRCAPRGARQCDGGSVVSRTPPGEPYHHRRYAQDCTSRADCLTLRIRHPHADFQSNGEPSSVRESRRPGRSFRGADRTAARDRAHTELRGGPPTEPCRKPKTRNGFAASRPNGFRTGSRTGPRWLPAHAPSPPRDPRPDSRRLRAGVVRARSTRC